MTTETEHYEAWVCTDCYYAYHGLDEDETEAPDSEPLGLIDPAADVSDNTCSSHDGGDETACIQCSQTGYEDGITEFSWSRCDGCGSHLGGSRYRLAVWPTTTTTNGA